jgi:hypothetical protein
MAAASNVAAVVEAADAVVAVGECKLVAAMVWVVVEEVEVVEKENLEIQIVNLHLWLRHRRTGHFLHTRRN